MALNQFIINDLRPSSIDSKISDLQGLFNQLTYSHIPIQKEGVFMGCLSETDVYCFEAQQTVNDVQYAMEGFFVRAQDSWLDVLEAFAQNEANIMPVLDNNNAYLGYYELTDIISLFNKTPFFAEPGHVVIVEKGYNDMTFSEISQIVESNNAKLLGAFISNLENDRAQITIKVSNCSLNDIVQSFRRYSYTIVSGHEEDRFLEILKERSNYLNKYLNL